MAYSEPIDTAAEQVVLGSILADPETYYAIEDLFDERVFFDPYHSTIAQAVSHLLKNKKPTDPVTVIGWLRERSLDDSVPTALELPTHATTIATYVRGHAERLKNLWALRERRKVARDILADTDPGAAEEKLASDASRLLAIETGKVTSAVSATDILVKRMEELEEEWKRGEQDRWSRQVPTGIKELDGILNGMEPGELVLFAARPGVGKSSVAIAVSEHTGGMGIPTGVFWLEDYQKQYASRVLSRRSLVPHVLLRHGSSLRSEHFESLQLSVAATQGYPIYVDDTHGMTARQVAQRMRKLHRQYGVRVFIADHLGEFRLEREERWGERHDLSMGEAMKIYRDTAADLGAVPILMAQLGRDYEKRGGEPKLSDIFGTGIAEQVVRVAVFLGRRQDQSLYAQIVKNTNGPKGEVDLHWEPDTMSIRSKPASSGSLPMPRYDPLKNTYTSDPEEDD